jgi:hypothetical protein
VLFLFEPTQNRLVHVTYTKVIIVHFSIHIEIVMTRREFMGTQCPYRVLQQLIASSRLLVLPVGLSANSNLSVKCGHFHEKPLLEKRLETYSLCFSMFDVIGF